MGSEVKHGSGSPGLHPPQNPSAARRNPSLRPPGTLPDPVAGGTPGTRWVWVALVVMLVVGLAVVFLLPQLVSRNESARGGEPAAEGLPAAVAPQGPAPVVAHSDAARSEAEQNLQGFLRLRARLELENAAAWGEPEWGQGAEAAASGDRMFAQRRFRDAAAAYGNALRTMQVLDSSRVQRQAEALAAGQEALGQDDGETARVAFERVLAISPDHPEATAGLARARVRADVVRYMEAGKAAETDADLEGARAAYQQALQLDGEYRAARAALQRVTGQITEIAWRAAMSEALAALDAGRLQAAGEALEEAAGLKPDDSAVQDARQRLLRARQHARLNSLRRQATARVGEEDWQAAVNLYNKALAVDSSAGFAREGLAQARDRLRLHQQIDHYLDDPERLYSPEPLANAEQLLVSAGNPPGAEPRLAMKISALQRHIMAARTPLPVTLHSDGETRVVIYHVGRLGQFLTHDLELRPGSYTAVGSRPGYRDVRRVFMVQPGKPPPALSIRCEELI